ncbi:GATA transcription factor 27-like [Neltuma alba]|uniref:GATA transcription factor 27-like n=1 Tax=Neltuma alba TaxID=207710 RepID=UPI0010A35497|nr:GATA transcription factor 27-like [Prosopis alba]
MWRNGPTEKPVLCNACGSRYRLWGCLDSYIPKHALPPVKPRNLYSPASDHLIKHNPKQFSLGNSVMSPLGKLNPASSWTSSPIPSRKRSETLHERLTEMDRFKLQIQNSWKQDSNGKKKKKQSSSSAASSSSSSSSLPEEDVLITQKLTNHMIPSNEIGLGGMLLNLD